MSTTCEGKSSWPELVGASGATAATRIESENPQVDAIVVLDGASVTGDFRCDRVRILLGYCSYDHLNNKLSGKSSWPELVGASGAAAAARIESENPQVDAIVVLDGASITGDFRCDRVRILLGYCSYDHLNNKSGKSSWPELVGARGSRATARIESENSRVDAIVVVEGRDSVTFDFRCDRVWVWVNSNGVVLRTPVIG
ncbi:hypothetical protein SSX86_022200 [Deinandra increscens subsp. villosa]|uniref:Uncharacterized protein n=1 Tax=Deinandra increscens subsp. villosa TaxID=3103831 RepID=A0AAP0CNL1_9ASTR